VSGRGPGVALVLAAAALGAGACAGLGRLDLPPGHQAVVGRIDLSGFDRREAILPLVREDRAYVWELRVGPGSADFVIGLPPGRYRVTELRVADDLRTLADQPFRQMSLELEVGRQPVYVGTVRLASRFGGVVTVEVVDDYEATLGRVRARHRDLAGPVARVLARVPEPGPAAPPAGGRAP
jgi:hypothetical protein